MLSRRQLLLRTATGLGALALPGTLLRGLARAAVDLDRYFVFLYFEGGWDHLLGLDPRDPAVFTNADVGETGIQTGYELLPAQFPKAPIDAGPFLLGPAVGELAGVTDLFSIVRGINMATLTHEVGRRYMLTGRPPAGTVARGSSVASIAVSQLGGEAPVPSLAVAVESYTESHLPSFAQALPVAAAGHLRYILQESLGIPTVVRPGVRDALAAYWKSAPPCDEDGAGTSKLAAQYRESRERASALVKEHLHEHFVFDSAELAPVRQHYGFAPLDTESAGARAATCAQALKIGLSRVVSVTLTGALDTHDGQWATDHPTRLEAGFTALARLLADLRDTEAPGGGSMLDRTTLVAFSEFGRTAALNARNGRDHLLTNCALVAGAGVKHGLVVGASSDQGMSPEHVDLATGLPSAAGTSLKPDHVMTTVLASAGLETKELRSEPIPALLA